MAAVVHSVLHRQYFGNSLSDSRQAPDCVMYEKRQKEQRGDRHRRGLRLHQGVSEWYNLTCCVNSGSRVRGTKVEGDGSVGN